jgi:hypothetical protein
MDFSAFYFIIVAFFSDFDTTKKVEYYTVDNKEKVYIFCNDQKYTKINLKSLD